MASKRDALKKEYSEVAQNFRLLTNIRFRLLSFLPLFSALAAVLVKESKSISATDQALLSLLGVSISLGLVSYDARNNQLYDELIGRAADIERTLGVPDGQFGTRPRPWLEYPYPLKWKVDHRNALRLIYLSAVLIWMCLFFGLVFQVIGRRPDVFGGSHSEIFEWAGILFGFVLTLTIDGWLRVQREDREDRIRLLLRNAYRFARNAPEPTKLLRSKPFIDACVDVILGQAGLSARGKGKAQFAETAARANFLAERSPEERRRYVVDAPASALAAAIVAQLTDYPPRYVFDCGEDRRGRIAKQEAKARHTNAPSASSFSDRGSSDPEEL